MTNLIVHMINKRKELYCCNKSQGLSLFKGIVGTPCKVYWCNQITIMFIPFLFMLSLILIVLVVIFIAEALEISILQYMHIRVVLNWIAIEITYSGGQTCLNV